MSRESRACRSSLQHCRYAAGPDWMQMTSFCCINQKPHQVYHADSMTWQPPKPTGTTNLCSARCKAAARLSHQVFPPSCTSSSPTCHMRTIVCIAQCNAALCGCVRSWQAEQQARLEAQLELNLHKKKVAGLEAELQQQQTAMNQVSSNCSAHCSCDAVLHPLSCTSSWDAFQQQAAASGRWGMWLPQCPKLKPAPNNYAHVLPSSDLVCPSSVAQQHTSSLNLSHVVSLQVLSAKSKAEEAAATSAAALSAAERKAKLYRGDSTALLSDYDAWVQSLLAKKSSSGSGGTPASANGAAAARGTSSLFNSTTGAAATAPAESGSWAGRLQSPIREGGLSRNVSQLASPAGHLASPGGARDADLERYDRIAALLDNRAGSSLSRSLSGKAPPLSLGPLAASSSSIGSPAATARNGKGTRVSPRPSFR